MQSLQGNLKVMGRRREDSVDRSTGPVAVEQGYLKLRGRQCECFDRVRDRVSHPQDQKVEVGRQGSCGVKLLVKEMENNRMSISDTLADGKWRE